ncbi:MAG: hypothetical protein Q8P90_02500 [bacterium]|nr:hypothetical protein [bacterium]
MCIMFGAFIFFYAGPGYIVINGFLSDVVAVMFIYLLLGIFWRVLPVIKLAFAVAITIGFEMLQLTPIITQIISPATEVVAASTLDLYDIVAFIIGGLLAFGTDYLQIKKRQPKDISFKMKF